jgi:hypothetical protein
LEQIDKFIQQLSDSNNKSKLPDNYITILEDLFSSYLNQIAQLDSFDVADNLLLELGIFQEHLATLSFKYNVYLSPRLNKFVNSYDRPDDLMERKKIYKMINKGELI